MIRDRAAVHQTTGEARYTGNQSRGDHMLIPGFTEDGNVFKLDVSFYKGAIFVQRVDFPPEPSHLRDALQGLHESCETR